MSSPRPSWRPLVAGALGLFLVILAFLAGQLKAGADPALGRTTAATEQAERQQPQQQQQQTAPPGFGTDPSAPGGSSDDGFVPGGSAPAPPVPSGSGSSSDQAPSSDAPSTHQS
jgi:hypothetical protein